MNVQPFGPGVTLIAGPESMPLTEALAIARASNARIYLIGGEPRELTPADQGAVELGALHAAQEWLDTLPGPALVVVKGATALGGWLAAERPEDRLLRLLDDLRLHAQAGLVILEPLPLDRLLTPDRAMARLLSRADRRELWTEQGLLRADSVLANRGHPSLPKDALAHEAWFYLAMAAVCAVAIAVALRPTLLGAHMGVRLLGDVGEGLPRHLWLTSWIFERFERGGDWASSQNIFWPLGVDVVATFGNIAANLIAAPLQGLLGFPRYWNVYVSAALLCNGVAMGWLARTQGADRTGALLAALAFSIAPPMLKEVGRASPEVFWAAPFLMALGLGLRAARGDRRDAWMTGIALALTSLFWWTYGLLAASLLALVYLARGARAPAERGMLLGQAGAALRLWAPAIVGALPVLAAINRGHTYDLGELYLPGQSGPSFATTLAFHRMTTDVLPLDELLAIPSLSLGWIPTVLIFGLIGTWLVLQRGARLFWVGVAAGSAVLALGPWLAPSWGMARGWLPLPLRALQSTIPLVDALDRPDRLLIVGAVALCLTLALVWHPLSRLLPTSRRPAALGGVVAGLALVPMLSGALPVPSYDYAPPEWTKYLKAPGAIIHLPLGWSEASILWAPLHGHPVAGGPDEVAVMRDPTPYSTAFQQNPALAWFRTLDAPPLSPTSRGELARLGARYVVVEAEFMRRLMASGAGPEYEMLEPLMERIDVALGPPIYDEDGVKLYMIDPTP